MDWFDAVIVIVGLTVWGHLSQRIGWLEKKLETTQAELDRVRETAQQAADWGIVLFEDFESMRPGTTRRFDLTTYTDEGTPMEFPIEYIHERFEFRTAGRKDAVAHGKARNTASHEAYADARILFSQRNKTATLRGLGWLEGQVKYADMRG